MMNNTVSFNPKPMAKFAKPDQTLTTTWCASIARLQMEKLTPEKRAAMLHRAQRRRTATRMRRKCCKKMSYSRRAKSSWGSHTISLRSAPMANYRSLSLSSTMHRDSIHSDMAEEDDCEAREEAASFRSCVELPSESVMEQMAADPTHGIDESVFRNLLKDFAVEPSDDEGLAAKFKLYEDYVETVSSSRADTLKFWIACKKDFLSVGDGSAAASVDRSLKAIDRADNLAIDFTATCWFVQSMIKKANANEKIIQRVLSAIKTKVDLLSQSGECPICLEHLEDENATVLGCCHKVCTDCWTQWKKVKNGRAFCPLCRHEDFVTDVATMGAVPLDSSTFSAATATAAPAPAASAATVPVPAATTTTTTTATATTTTTTTAAATTAAATSTAVPVPAPTSTTIAATTTTTTTAPAPAAATTTTAPAPLLHI